MKSCSKIGRIRQIAVSAVLFTGLISPLVGYGQSPQTDARTSAYQASKKRLEDDLKVYITVNGEPIFRWELRLAHLAWSRTMAMQGESYRYLQTDWIERQATQDLVSRELLNQEARNRGIYLTQTEKDQVWAQYLGQFEPITTARDQILNLLAKAGFARDQVTRAAYRMGVVQKFARELVSRMEVSEKEIRDFYFARLVDESSPDFFKVPEKVGVRHILIEVRGIEPILLPQSERVRRAVLTKDYEFMTAITASFSIEALQKRQAEKNAEAAAMAMAESLLAKIKKGTEFQDMARTNSSDRLSARRGGDLGFCPRGVLPPPIEEVAFGLGPGETWGAPVKTPAGFHLIQVYNRIPEHTAKYDETKDQIESVIRGRHVDTQLFSLLEDLRSKSYIDDTEARERRAKVDQRSVDRSSPVWRQPQAPGPTFNTQPFGRR